ncbi:universal stress protein [Nitrosopumilus sp.]|uniref:universal stress protein n=1 Tax=Nitrosopumilus sp. TaxID=2024843 RepID=UPI00260FC3CC|nr:universal stress protein [Nitrosopumilus sp.]
MYEKILVPHAGSPAGDKALEHAGQIASTNNSALTILHVVEHIPIPPSLSLSGEKKQFAQDLKKARGEMKTQMHILLESKAVKLRKKGIPTSIKVVHGYPDEEIIRIANEGKYDMVIMAKRKKLSGVKGILKLGSISRKVLEKIFCPVLLIDGEKK